MVPVDELLQRLAPGRIGRPLRVLGRVTDGNRLAQEQLLRNAQQPLGFSGGAVGRVSSRSTNLRSWEMSTWCLAPKIAPIGGVALTLPCLQQERSNRCTSSVRWSGSLRP